MITQAHIASMGEVIADLGWTVEKLGVENKGLRKADEAWGEQMAALRKENAALTQKVAALEKGEGAPKKPKEKPHG